MTRPQKHLCTESAVLNELSHISIVGETGAPWDMGKWETGLFDAEIILRFVCHLVNDNKTNWF